MHNAFLKYIQIVHSLREAKLGFLLVPKYHYAHVRNNGLTPLPHCTQMYASIFPLPPLFAYILNGCPHSFYSVSWMSAILNIIRLNKVVLHPKNKLSTIINVVNWTMLWQHCWRLVGTVQHNLVVQPGTGFYMCILTQQYL
jgi:hypothetical protein